MCFVKTAALLIFSAILLAGDDPGYKILGLFPWRGRSHAAMFQSVMKGLALRGHQVHVLSHYPLETPIGENYTDLSVRGSIPFNQIQFETFSFGNYDLDFIDLRGTIRLYTRIDTHENVMRSEAVRNLMRSKERYDLIITETFVTDMALGFVHKFKVPFIFLSPCGTMTPWANQLVANPQNPAIVPYFSSSFSPRMTFSERLINTLGLIANMAAWRWFIVPRNEKIMHKYFGEDLPPLAEIARNVSLILSNSHSVIVGSRPSVPAVVEVGGIHIEPTKKLPKDIAEFIESSTHGVIYFCLGSLLRTASLPKSKKEAFLDAFSRLNERILWKNEDEDILVPQNVMVKKWMPQSDILAHPKVKLFISHGGLFGTLEAISAGKPILGMPIFSDQRMNLRSFEIHGSAKRLDYETVNNQTILKAIRETLQPRYTERARKISELFHDRPMKPMDTAIYWIEYVIRNNGARNLRSTEADLHYFQYMLIDVALFLVVCGIGVVFFSYCVIRCLIPKKKFQSYNKLKLR